MKSTEVLEFYVKEVARLNIEIEKLQQTIEDQNKVILELQPQEAFYSWDQM